MRDATSLNKSGTHSSSFQKLDHLQRLGDIRDLALDPLSAGLQADLHVLVFANKTTTRQVAK
jgi:hypothetical protein